MEVRCAGNSPKDNSDCMNGAVSVSYLFSFRLPPLGENAVVEKHTHTHTHIALSPKGGSLKEKRDRNTRCPIHTITVILG